MLIFLRVWQPHPDTYVPLFIVTGLWGFADGIWNVQTNCKSQRSHFNLFFFFFANYFLVLFAGAFSVYKDLNTLKTPIQLAQANLPGVL